MGAGSRDPEQYSVRPADPVAVEDAETVLRIMSDCPAKKNALTCPDPEMAANR